MAQLPYRPEIDGLRALAVLAVMLFHAGIPFFGGGFVGVDVFFVISGYLITSLIISELRTESFSLLKFYERRARRILPVLFFISMICIPCAWLILPPLDLYLFAKSLVALPLFLSNYLFWQEGGYFATANELKPLMHTWSLGVEEQFYLVVPLSLMLVWRRARRWLVMVIGGFFIISLVAFQAALETRPDDSFYLLQYRGWELLLGSLTALLLLRVEGNIGSALLCELVAGLGLALLLFGILFLDDATPLPGMATLLATMATALTVLFGRQHTLVGKLLGHRLLVAIGLVSYSAYLWHQPLLVFTRNLTEDEPSSVVLLLVLSASLVLAWLSWRYIEVPFRKSLLLTRAQLARWGVCCAFMLLMAGFLIMLEDGFPERFNDRLVYEGDIGQEEYFAYMESHSYRCTPEFIAKRAPDWEGFVRCRQSKAEGDIDVAIIGDSHAEQIFQAVAEMMPNSNVVYYIDTSRMLLGNPRAAETYAYVLQTSSIRTIILTMNWRRRMRDTTSKETDMQKDLTNTLRTLVAGGKNVYLLGDVPVFPFGPSRCKYSRVGLLRTALPRCDIDAMQQLEAEAAYMPPLRQSLVTLPTVKFAEPASAFCSAASCSMVRNGVLMYRDDEHLNIQGSRYLRQVLTELLPELAN